MAKPSIRNYVIVFVLVMAVGFVIAYKLQKKPARKKTVAPTVAPRVKVYRPPAPRRWQVPPPTPLRVVGPKVTAKKKAKPSAPPRPRYRFVLRSPNAVTPAYAKPLPRRPLSFYRVSRAKFKAWADMPLKDMGVLYRPNREWGRPRGMKISTLEQNSFLRRFGFKEGDILLSVNGVPLVSPGYAKRQYQKIAKRYRDLSFKFKRKGIVYNLDFSLKASDDD